MKEDVLVQGIPFTDNVSLTLQGTITDSQIEFDCRVQAHMPWMLSMFTSQVNKHIIKSLDEYIVLLTSSVCAESSA